MMKYPFLLLVVLLINGCTLSSTEGCGGGPSVTKDFTDTMMLAIPPATDTIFMLLSKSDYPNSTYEVVNSSSLTDSLLLFASVHGGSIKGNVDSVKSRKQFNWKHDTLSAIFDYSSTMIVNNKKNAVTNFSESTDTMLCTPAKEYYIISHVQITIPQNTVLMMVDAIDWKKK